MIWQLCRTLTALTGYVKVPSDGRNWCEVRKIVTKWEDPRSCSRVYFYNTPYEALITIFMRNGKHALNNEQLKWKHALNNERLSGF